MKRKEDEIILWGGEYDEVLSCETLDEYIYDFLDSNSDCHESLPREITVCGFKRGKVSSEFAKKETVAAIENLHESLMEKYGYEDEIPLCNDGVDKLTVAINEICEKFVPWTCEVVTKEGVNLVDWVNENASELISEISFKELQDE